MAVEENRLRRLFHDAITIDIRMIPSKLVYILYGAILGLHMPYINIFFVAIGLTPSQAGYISGIRYASAALAGPVWGMIVDYTGRRKLIMTIISLGSAFPLFTMPWVARAVHPNVDYVCSNGTLNATFEMAIGACERTRQKEILHLFYIMLAITVIGSMFVMCMPGYVDSIAINVVKTGQKKASYGAQRIFGSIAFTAANFLGGFAADHYHHPELTSYTAVFWMYLPTCMLLIPAGCYLVGQSNFNSDEEERVSGEANNSQESERNKGTWRDSLVIKVLLLLRKFDVSFFMMTVFISGLANSLYLSLSFIFVRQIMHVSKTQMTYVVSTGSISELAIFPFASKIIKKVGAIPCITLGIFSYFIRFLSMSYATEFWMAVVIQLLHGIGFALAWAAMMEYTHIIAPPEISGTMFNMMCGIFYSWSALVANMVGGRMYDEFGGRRVFRYFAILYAGWTVLMIIYYGGQYLKKKHDSKFGNTIRYQASHENSVAGKLEGGERGFDNPLGITNDENV